jgi:NADH:ubiquinone oxidoreductase subunit 3 (subunit A)
MVIALLFLLVTILAAKLVRPSSLRYKTGSVRVRIKAAGSSCGHYISLLHHRDSVRNLRRGNDLPVPVAVRYQQLGWFGVVEVRVFLVILVVGYVWAYKKAPCSGCKLPSIA